MSAPSLRARAPRAAADSAPAGSSGAIEPPRKRGRPKKVVAAAAAPEDERDGFEEHDTEDTDMAAVVAGGAAAANGFSGHEEGSADGAPAPVVDHAEREVLEKLAVVLSVKDFATILRSCCGFSTTPLSLGLAPVHLHSNTPTQLLSGTDEGAPTIPENVADIGVMEALRRIGLEEQVLRWEGALSWGNRLWEGLAGPTAAGPVEDGKKRKSVEGGMTVEAKKYKRSSQTELKRPPTAFLMFRAARGFKDPKEASEAWKSLPQDEKEDFEARFKDAFDEYKNAQAQWEYTHGTSYPTRREKPARPEGIPKRPLSAFLAFRRDRGLRNVVEAGQAWRELPPDEKGIYEAQTMQEMAAYKAAVRVWKDANPGAKLFERKSSKKKAAAAAAAEEDLEEEEEDYDGDDAITDKPKRGRKPLPPGAPRPPPTAWVDFLHNSGKTRKEASEAWKNMSEDARRPWVRRYEAQKAFYLQQKAIWEANQGLGVNMEGVAAEGWDEEPLEDEDGAAEEDELAEDIAPKLPFGYPADYA